MVTFQIDKIGKTKTGNLSLTAVSGEKYYAKVASGLGNKAGATIEAETSNQTFDDGRTLVWVNEWKLAANQAPAQPQQQYSREPVAPAGRFSATGVDLALLPFTSNIVANAVRAGHIDSPDKLAAWTQAAYRAAQSLGNEPAY